MARKSSKKHDVRKLLRRFTKAQLLNDIWETVKLPNNMPKRWSKEEIISHVAKNVERTEDLEKITILLELKYCQIRISTRQWSVLEIKNPEICLENTTEADKFARKLRKYLNRSQLSCEVVSQFHNNKMWTAVSIQHRLTAQPVIFFLLAESQSPFLVHTNLKASYEQVLYRSLVQLFQGTECQKFSLKNKNVDHLLQYASQNSTLAECSTDDNLLVEKKERQVKEVVSLPQNVIDLDVEEDNKRRLYFQNLFGVRKKPVMESLTINVTSPFFGFDNYEKGRLTTCRCTFKGQNVLEGIQQLGIAGKIEYPLPDTLSQVLNLGINNANVRMEAIDNENSEE